MEEACRESKYQKKSFFLVLLDAKSAFDEVNHSSPAWACADDLGLNVNTEEDVQIMTDMSEDFGCKQLHEIQADKSATVNTPAGRLKESDSAVITITRQEIPTVQSCTHLVIQHSTQYKETILDTVNENVKKKKLGLQSTVYFPLAPMVRMVWILRLHSTLLRYMSSCFIVQTVNCSSSH